MKNKKLKIIFIVLIVAGFIVINLPYFYTKNINVVNAQNVSQEQILSLSESKNYSGNIFYYRTHKYEKILEENPYIEEANIKRVLPDTLEIDITEREPIAYVEYINGTYLYIDKDGRVLEVKDVIADDKSIPIITGIQIPNYKLNETIEMDDDVLATTLELSEIFHRYDIVDTDLKINLNHLDNIIIEINKMDVMFGTIDNADEKLSRVIASIDAMKETGLDEYRGIYHVEDITKDSYFQLLN